MVVQTVAQQNGIFNVSFFDKLRLEFPLYKNRFCLIKFHEGQNLDQWNDLIDKIKVNFKHFFTISYLFIFIFILTVYYFN